MSDIIDALDTAAGAFEDNCRLVDEEQKQYLFSNYNWHAGRFYYGQDVDAIIFGMPAGKFGSFEYYLGFEYEREHINFKLEHENMLYVGYDDQCGRAKNLYEKFEEISPTEEQEEDEEDDS